MSSALRNIFRRLVHNDLPFGCARLLLLIGMEVFSIVGGGLCLKIWTK
jgi:hypothetical protein